MALKFNCSKCGEIIAVKFVKPGHITNCGKCGASNTVPVNAVEIPNEQIDGYSKLVPKVNPVDAPAKTDEKIAAKNEPTFTKARIYCASGIVIGVAISFFVPSQILYLNGLSRWMVVMTSAFIFGVIGFVTGAPANTAVNNSATINRYPALRVIIGYYKILAGTVAIFTLIISLSFFFTAPTVYFPLRILGAVVVFVLGAALYVTLRAMSEGIAVVLDIEENTRRIR